MGDLGRDEESIRRQQELARQIMRTLEESGAMEQIAAAQRDLQQMIGRVLAPSMERLADQIRQMVQALEPTFQQMAHLQRLQEVAGAAIARSMEPATRALAVSLPRYIDSMAPVINHYAVAMYDIRDLVEDLSVTPASPPGPRNLPAPREGFGLTPKQARELLTWAGFALSGAVAVRDVIDALVGDAASDLQKLYWAVMLTMAMTALVWIAVGRPDEDE